MTLKRTGELFEEALTRSVIGAFYEVYRELGFGFREFIYARSLQKALAQRGHSIGREGPTMVYYKGEPLAQQTLDMIVDDKLLIEIKATEQLHPDAATQLFSYLSATELQVGLVLNFGRKAKFHRVFYENRLKRHLHGS
jgi:GxxExxY protein